MSIEEILNFMIPFTSITVFNIISAIVVIVAGYIIAIIFSKYLKRTMLKAKMTDILAEFTSRVVKILVIIFAFAVAIGFLGIDVGSAVISLSVVSGFVFGFAFQETLGNLAAGFMIAITKPFRVGDYVDIAGNAGSINHVGASITTMTTYDNKRIVIPNSKIWGNPIVNYTALNQRMIDMRVGISYKDNIGKAITIALNVIKKHEKVITDPAPTVAVADLGDSSVNLLVRPWVQTSDYWKVKWDLTQQIKEAFDKEGITIPFPQTDVHLFQKK
ncbi:MAG: mechanosensitive ion channel [Candidatus Thermoplasmatota archaeon]|nr:mechanosensitive ion channel [Candidatus Thermoplasmatota archaeon]